MRKRQFTNTAFLLASLPLLSRHARAVGKAARAHGCEPPPLLLAQKAPDTLDLGP